jgi:mono/diheme cytochrome c family protein
MSTMNQRQPIWMGMGVVAAGIVAVTLAVAQQAPGDLAERGRMLSTRHCAECHGLEGQGRVRGNATALNNLDLLAWASDGFLEPTIARGRRGTEMRGWARDAGGPLDPEDSRALVAFVRTWQGEASQPPTPRVGRGHAARGRELYEMACVNCHGWEGRGELGMGPTLNNPDFLAAADDVLLWATIAYGRRETPMFPSLRGLGGVRQFSVPQIDDLVAYLRSWQHRH